MTRLDQLKQRVGFDAAIATEHVFEYVVLDANTWPIPPSLRAWQCDAHVDQVDDWVLHRRRFTREASIISFHVSVFPRQDRRRVAEALLERATAVTTVEVSDRRGPLDLGTLSLVRGSDHTVYWCFRNVLAQVVTFRTAHDAIDLARGLQLHLAASVRPSNSLKSH